MKRLTHRYMDGTAWVSLNLVSKMGEHECVGLPITKLATYEDAEEQGLLIRLPCKVGDTVYVDSTILPIEDMECYEDIDNKIPLYFPARVVSFRFAKRNWMKIAEIGRAHV